LQSDAGWRKFASDARNFGSMERPPYMARFSTAAESVSCVTLAVFNQVKVHKRSPLMIVVGQNSKTHFQ
jgi:hypothetical protein